MLLITEQPLLVPWFQVNHQIRNLNFNLNDNFYIDLNLNINLNLNLDFTCSYVVTSYLPMYCLCLTDLRSFHDVSLVS